MVDQFTICVLLYGKFTSLASRCIKSICDGAPEVLPLGLRIGMNECCNDTKQFVQKLVRDGHIHQHNLYKSYTNIHKYPMMRRMFYDPANPITTPFTMWFDDDSFIKTERFDAQHTFLGRVFGEISGTATGGIQMDMLGARHTMPLAGNQHQWIEDQPWYNHVAIRRNMPFATGGWWTARTELLKRFNYPWPRLDHRGGDVMLGACLEQQGLRLRNYNYGVAINADDVGKQNGAPRRGFNQPAIGVNYQRMRKQTQPPPPPAAVASPGLIIDL